jgi:hypothetical protein
MMFTLQQPFLLRSKTILLKGVIKITNLLKSETKWIKKI